MDLQITFDSRQTQRTIVSPGRVVVAETGINHHQQLLFAGRHMLLADRSAQDGGDDTGPDPKALMMMALGSHLSMALRATADKRGWALEQILVHFDATCASPCYALRGNDRLNAPRVTCAIELIGELDDRQQARLVEIANQHLTEWSRSRVCTEVQS
jgi:uncharacterized OsmC-like protein